MRPRTRVLAIHPGAELYGSDRMFLATAEALREGDADVMALLPNDGPLGDALRAQDIEVTVADFPVLRRVQLKGLRGLRELGRFIVETPRCVRLLRRHRPDVVYVSTLICPIWLVAATIARTRIVAHVHENEREMRPLASRVLLGPLRLASTVVANSHSTFEWLTTTSPGLGARTTVVSNGVVGPPPGMAAARVEREGGPARLVVIGRLAERKGQDVAIRAAQALGARGYEVELTLVGSSFPGYEGYADGLHVLAGQVGEGVTICFGGFADEPWPALSQADVALVPSLIAESFGNVAVEALLAGVPTVTSDVPGLREIVRDRETGRLVAPGDAQALAEAIAELLDDRPWALRLAATGQRDVRERFAIDRYKSAMRQVLAPPSTAYGRTRVEGS